MKAKDLKRLSILVLGCALLLGGRPAAAEDNSCAGLVADLAQAGGRIGSAKGGLSQAISALKELEAYVEAMIEADRIADEGIEMTDEVVTFSSEVSTITEPIPSVHTPIARIKTVLADLKRYALEPIKKVLDSAVVAPRLKDNLPRIRKLRDGLEKLEKPVSLMATAVSGYKLVADKDCRKAESSKDDQTRAENARIVGATRASIGKVSPELDSANRLFGQTEHTVRHDLLAALKPFKAIDKPIDDMHGAVKDVHRAMRDFDHTLHHEVHIKVAGATVAKFTIHEILHDWDKAIHKLEHDLHIENAKKWLETELDKILSPVIKTALRPLKRIEDQAKVEAKDFAADAKAAFDGFEKRVEQAIEIHSIDGDLNGYAERMKALAAKS